MNYHLINNAQAFRHMFEVTIKMGQELVARGSTFTELEGFQLVVHSKYPFIPPLLFYNGFVLAFLANSTQSYPTS